MCPVSTKPAAALANWIGKAINHIYLEFPSRRGLLFFGPGIAFPWTPPNDVSESERCCELRN